MKLTRFLLILSFAPHLRARLLNGDETHPGRHIRLPPDRFGAQRVRVYRYR